MAIRFPLIYNLGGLSNRAVEYAFLSFRILPNIRKIDELEPVVYWDEHRVYSAITRKITSFPKQPVDYIVYGLKTISKYDNTQFVSTLVGVKNVKLDEIHFSSTPKQQILSHIISPSTRAETETVKCCLTSYN